MSQLTVCYNVHRQNVVRYNFETMAVFNASLQALIASGKFVQGSLKPELIPPEIFYPIYVYLTSIMDYDRDTYTDYARSSK